MVRWAWRLFRREWRRQALVLCLLMVAVAAMTVGLGVASNATNLKADPTFGTANTIITLTGSGSGSGTGLASDIASIQNRFGTVDVITHTSIPVPGSVSTVDLRAQNPHGPYGSVTLRLVSGQFPSGAGQVAVTRDVANTFGLHVGSIWNEGGRTRRAS
jgi:putative ABC transport system permease protein